MNTKLGVFLSLLAGFFCATHSYDKKYYKKALQDKQSTAVVIIAYNRPHYLKQLLDCLEKNPESQTLPFYFILDGGPKAAQEENCTIINNSTIKHKEIIKRERNYGYAKTVIDTQRFMFDWCKFDKIIFMEEDLLVSPFYLRLTLALHKWARQEYSNVGVVQCYSYSFLNREQKLPLLDAVQGSGNYWWSFVSYCMDRKLWNDIKSILYEYEKRFVDKIPTTEEYFIERSRPALWSGAPKIREWVRELVKRKVKVKRTDKKIFIDNKVNLREFFCSDFEPNQDLIFGFALWMKDYVKIQTVVNRARHIGEEGITFDPKYFVWMKHDKITLDNFEEDASLSNFRVIQS